MNSNPVSPFAAIVAISLLVANLAAANYADGDRVIAAPVDGNSINVRNADLAEPPIGQQYGGVHGTILGPPVAGSAGGFTGNWWPIRWDAGNWPGGPEGWCAEAVIAPALGGGNPAGPDFTNQHYTTDNHFWSRG